jgi:hypothetical protein
VSVSERRAGILGRHARLEKCPVCGRRYVPSSRGRPKTSCGRLECKAAQKRAQRAAQASRWSSEDWAEAVQRWGKCATCGLEGHALQPKARLRVPLLPVCTFCRTRPITARARRWLDRCRPFCPLPSPYSPARSRAAANASAAKAERDLLRAAQNT